MSGQRKASKMVSGLQQLPHKARSPQFGGTRAREGKAVDKLNAELFVRKSCSMKTRR